MSAPVKIDTKSTATATSQADTTANMSIPVDLGFTSAGQRGFNNNVSFGSGGVGQSDSSGGSSGKFNWKIAALVALAAGGLYILWKREH